AFDLGTSTLRFKDLYQSGNLISLGGGALDSDITSLGSLATTAAYFASDSTSTKVMIMGNQSAGTGGELLFTMTKSAALDANSAVESGDFVGAIRFLGADGTNYRSAAAIYASI